MRRQWSVSSSNSGTPVYLNIYSFCHCCNVVCGCIGLGLYHTAIQIFGIQYMFHGWAGNQTGVSKVMPKTCPYRFQQQIQLGSINYTYDQLQQRIQFLKQQFISNKYDLLNNNCNHFALTMAETLGIQKQHPRSYIFRITNCLNIFRCCIPNCILSGRLDWFTNKEQQQQQLSEIRNSQIKEMGNQSKYEQFIQEIEQIGQNQYRHLSYQKKEQFLYPTTTQTYKSSRKRSIFQQNK